MACGIDIGGTKMEIAIYDSSMKRGSTWRVPTPGHDYDAFLKAITQMVQRADAICGERQAVGLAVPGVVDGNGLSISANIPCINGRCVATDVERLIQRPAVYENDVRAFTLSEVRGGALDGAASAIGIVLGTGLGGTLCFDGKLHRGQQGLSGEFGHLPIPQHLIRKYDLPVLSCICGSMGCAEQILSGPGMLRVAAGLGAVYETVEALVSKLRQGEPLATRVFHAYIECLGHFISRLTLMLEPEVVVIGGGLSAVAEIYRRLPSAIGAYLFEGVTAPRITAPRFGLTSGARGAAILAFESFVPDRCGD